ncbi:MAG: Dna2/Cas4 domain-containing protein [Anaerolineaceae bacterium]|nr:Dna2/Cas4 domain-containing protein [Anaerolineaceae bacterium]MDD4043499.1 Dna2/Cas4 domain-containing protein [Anaerolineaceae bacterium]MDD4577244.1 Dna2/Cas4 domain-containing protein [Anaerolineaceae bacterium]
MRPIHWALLLLVLGILLWLLSRRQRKSSGLPDGALLYADSDYWQTLPKPLYDAELQLVGKPDYVIKDARGMVIPVELKSGAAPTRPWDSHIIQLAAYCRLIEKNFAQRPPYGIIRYQNKSFTIDYTDELETRLIALIAQMRQVEQDNCANRSHKQPARCRSCGYAQICDQRLT